MAIQHPETTVTNANGGADSGNMHGFRSLPTVNQQPAEKRITRDDGSLEVVNIFRTIQGEGPFAGEPAIFIRTAGCVLACPLCDTDYTTNRTLVDVSNIVFKVMGLISSTDNNEQINGYRPWLVVITGGEPLRQSCGPLVRRLVDSGCKVQIETNGMVNDRTLTEDTAISDFTVVCSPKGNVHGALMPNIDALKYVVKAGMVDPIDGLPTRALDLNMRPERPWLGFKGKVYVQPCDEQDEDKNRANMQAAIDSCMKFGYILGYQLHKVIGMK